MSELLQSLNEEQKKAVLHEEGPLMIIAGAGSGKTRVLTYRIAHLIAQGVDPFSILSLTFTNKAAREMKGRIGDLVGENEAKNLWMGTFHSIFARVLRHEADKLGFPSNFTIYDTQDSERLISSIIKELQLSKDQYKPKQIFSRISSFKNSLITVKAYYNNYDLQEQDKTAKREKLGEIYKEYVDRCFKAGAMDFDDLLLRTNELLNVYPEVLAKYQHKFKYILVDEYQDTNHSQYLIVRALADRYQNICVVGDDAQSIYSFRGANINNILNFQKDYPEVTTYRLEQNYRSTQTIVNASNSLINHNKVKLNKNVWTHNNAGEKIKVKHCYTDLEEGRFVAASIFDLKAEKQKQNNDFAILYRTNSQSRAIEESLRKHNIPYQIIGGISFYQRKEIKDVLAYLRLIVNPKDEESLKRIINYPARGIGQTTLDKLIVASKQYNCSLFEVLENLDKYPIGFTGATITKLNEFKILIERFITENNTLNASEMVEKVVKRLGFIRLLNKEETPEAIDRIENIQELINGVKDFVEGQKEIADATGSLSEFLQDVALITDLDTHKNNQNSVTLMTVHMAKGLEFPYVFIVGMEENLFPSSFNLYNQNDLEEERRLFYVALTRAQEKVFLSYAILRYRFGKQIDSEPSRFINEIEPEFLDYIAIPEKQEKTWVDTSIFDNVSKQKKNTFRKYEPVKESKPKNVTIPDLKVAQKIRHERFGNGVIVSLEDKGLDQKAVIDFDSIGRKKLLLRFAKLEVINT